MKKIIVVVSLALLCSSMLYASTSHKLWLDYKPVNATSTRINAKSHLTKIHVPDTKYRDVICTELSAAVKGIYNREVDFTSQKAKVIFKINPELNTVLGNEGYQIINRRGRTYISAADDEGLMYGAFHFIRLMQTGKPIRGLDIIEVPAFDLRMLNHWDDLDGNIERGYAGQSLWNWDELPHVSSDIYREYARANASIGINAVVLNNVNADPRILRADYLKKVAVLADIFREYNIRVYLTANFAAPMKPSSTPDVMKRWGGVGNLTTADPLNADVQDWWKEKVDEIYRLIHDFGGFLVKANSEGMPGPQDYGRTHADGANVLARALKPHGGIVMWRTFVYNPHIDRDRMKRAFLEFMPLDGKFDDNVVLQIKNGPLDFQPSEPTQPLFGALKSTPSMLELQITQEYLGHSTYLVDLIPMWKKTLLFNTDGIENGRTVADITASNKISAIAGVANTGSEDNWTGHDFAQSNWYAFGRLSWDPYENDNEIRRDWILSTWHTDDHATETIESMMADTWKIFTNASSPYGLGLTLDVATHFKANFKGRAGKEWQVNENGVGTDRTTAGTGFTAQYPNSICKMYEDIATCPEEILLSLHFVSWDMEYTSGKQFKEIFFEGLEKAPLKAAENIIKWESIKDDIDAVRFESVLKRLQKEKKDATTFKNEAVAYFSRFIK